MRLVDLKPLAALIRGKKRESSFCTVARYTAAAADSHEVTMEELSSVCTGASKVNPENAKAQTSRIGAKIFIDQLDWFGERRR